MEFRVQRLRVMGVHSKRRGFSLIEVMVSTVILGIGLIGLSHLHLASIRGLATDELLSTSSDIALQRAEELATVPPDLVPECKGAPTCRTIDGSDFTPEMNKVGGFACSKYVDGAAVRKPDGTSNEGTRYRVDVVVDDHPNALRQPDGRLVTVSVCWKDAGGRVHESQLKRFMVPGA